MIKVKNLSVHIQDKILLENIQLDISDGDYWVIVGPNGSGKSTLLKTLMGIQAPYFGQITLNQRHIKQYKQRERAQVMSYVPQNSGRELPFTVEEFVKMSRYSYHSPLSEWSKQDQLAIEEALVITDTQSFRTRLMKTLSGGECQRVMIAAALSQQTPLILLDEPTSYLDPHHQVEIHQLINQLNKTHQMTVIEVSHDINHAAHPDKQVLALREGRVLWQGSGPELLDKQRLKQLYQQDFTFVVHPTNQRLFALAETP